MILTAIYYPYSTDDGRHTMMDTVTIRDLTLGTHHTAFVPAMQTTLQHCIMCRQNALQLSQLLWSLVNLREDPELGSVIAWPTHPPPTDNIFLAEKC